MSIKIQDFLSFTMKSNYCKENIPSLRAFNIFMVFDSILFNIAKITFCFVLLMHPFFCFILMSHFVLGISLFNNTWLEFAF